MEFCLLDESGSRVSVKKDGGSYRPAADGSAVMTTDTNGRIHVIGLPVGTYSVEESTHPGYAALSASPQFTLTSAADITITNEPLTLELTKVDGYTGDPLPGVRFSLRDADGNAVPIQSIAEGLYYFNASAQGNTLVTGRQCITFPQAFTRWKKNRRRDTPRRPLCRWRSRPAAARPNPHRCGLPTLPRCSS